MNDETQIREMEKDMARDAEEIAMLRGRVDDLISKWRSEADLCNSGAGSESSQARIAARVAVGGTLKRCADELEGFMTTLSSHPQDPPTVSADKPGEP